ncbi:DUF6381 family protein [Streptomyces sp. NPDC055897]
MILERRVNVEDKYRARVRELQVRARELGEAAERATDPEHRRRLKDKARRAAEQCDRANRIGHQ